MKASRSQWVPFSLHPSEHPSEPPIGSIPDWVTPEQEGHTGGSNFNELANESIAVHSELLKRGKDPSHPEHLVSILALSAIAKDALASLHELATASHGPAALHLSACLRTAVKDLNAVAAKHPGKFEAVLKSAPTWPVLYSPHPQLATDTGHLESKLQHVELSLIGNSRRKGKDLAATSTNLAIRIYECISENRRRWRLPDFYPSLRLEAPVWVKHCGELPNFTSKSAKEWAEVGWEILLSANKGHPEVHSELGTLQSPDRPNGIRNELLKALKRLCKTHGER